MVWSKIEHEYLKNNKFEDIETLCDALNKTEDEIKTRLRVIRKEEGWTEEKEEYLIQHHGEHSSVQIADRLGMTSRQVTSRINKLRKEGRLPEVEDKFTKVERPMLENDTYFSDYYLNWVNTFKRGQVRNITLQKYLQAYKHIRTLSPYLTLTNITRTSYQELINKHAETHEKQTVQDFHTQIKACVMDALHEGDIDKNPCYKIVLTGKKKAKKKESFLNNDEFKKVIQLLDLSELGLDWQIYLAAMTGCRYGEILGITPSSLDFATNTIKVEKTLDYKHTSHTPKFNKPKTASSIRLIVVDRATMSMLAPLVKDREPDMPIFWTGQRIHNSTINNRLEDLCLEADVPVIHFHSLRHTHASMLLSQGVSMQSISKRLGHSKVSITQDVYLHITKELEAKDNKLITNQLEELLVNE